MGSSGDNKDGMAFQSGERSVMNCQSSGMSANPFFAPAWDPVVSLSQYENFGSSSIASQSEFSNSAYPVVMENQGLSSTSHLVHYPSDSSYVELVPKFPSYGSGSFSEMVGSFGLTDCGQIANSGCHPNYSSNKEANLERIITNGAQSHEDHRLTEKPIIGADGKRRKRVTESDSPFDPNKNAEGEVQKDPSGHSSDVQKELDEKKPRTEQNTAANLRGKQAAKQGKDNSNSGEAPKENYIHVRARRGQATNSHSLAERVRREKISERMRLLQELVPGCNKITGKAVMLDEIINYVQSLQQQVEFLSMKLATVNPELNIDIERILSKDILHARGGNRSIMGFSHGINTHTYSHGIFPASVPAIPNANPQFPTVPATVSENDLQSLYQMGFDSSSAVDSFGPNGRLKPDI